MSLKRIRSALERHTGAGLLTLHEAREVVRGMRRANTDDELREIVRSGSEDIETLDRAQLWRLVRGEPYADVVR